MNQLLLGRYVPGDSLLHNLDPRAKLVAAILFIILVFSAANWFAFFYFMDLNFYHHSVISCFPSNILSRY